MFWGSFLDGIASVRIRLYGQWKSSPPSRRLAPAGSCVISGAREVGRGSGDITTLDEYSRGCGLSLISQVSICASIYFKSDRWMSCWYLTYSFTRG